MESPSPLFYVKLSDSYNKNKDDFLYISTLLRMTFRCYATFISSFLCPSPIKPVDYKRQSLYIMFFAELIPQKNMIYRDLGLRCVYNIYPREKVKLLFLYV